MNPGIPITTSEDVKEQVEAGLNAFAKLMKEEARLEFAEFWKNLTAGDMLTEEHLIRVQHFHGLFEEIFIHAYQQGGLSALGHGMKATAQKGVACQ